MTSILLSNICHIAKAMKIRPIIVLIAATALVVVSVFIHWKRLIVSVIVKTPEAISKMMAPYSVKPIANKALEIKSPKRRPFRS